MPVPFPRKGAGKSVSGRDIEAATAPFGGMAGDRADQAFQIIPQ